MKPVAAEFTKDSPVTKLEIWQCFRRAPHSFAMVLTSEAHAIMGKNAHRGMERNGYLATLKQDDGDYYQLTEAGEQWLIKGMRSYLRNHPARVHEVDFPPSADSASGATGAPLPNAARLVRQRRRPS